MGNWAADIIAGIAGNTGGDVLGSFFGGETPGVAVDMISNVPGISYDVTDVVIGTDSKPNSIMLDNNGYPFTGVSNGIEYYNGLELTDGFKLGTGVNGELLPVVYYGED